MTGSTSTPSPLELALANVPEPFRKRLISSYLKLKREYAGSRFDAAGIDAGKLCETVLRLLQEELTKTHIPFGKEIRDFPGHCRKLIETPVGAGPESLRTVIPRAIVFLNTMRGKRAVAHVGGDVDANRIDAATMTRVADWIVCELIRVFHGMSLEEAQDVVDGLSVRDLPEVWEIGETKRVLTEGLTKKQQTLLLLYSGSESAVLAEALFGWVEYGTFSNFKKDVLQPLHKERLIEFDTENGTVHLSPLGAQEVETKILAKG